MYAYVNSHSQLEIYFLAFGHIESITWNIELNGGKMDATNDSGTINVIYEFILEDISIKLRSKSERESQAMVAMCKHKYKTIEGNITDNVPNALNVYVVRCLVL